MTTSLRRRLAARAAVLVVGLALAAPTGAAAQALPHAGLLQAYRQSVTYLASTLQQSNRLAAIDASVTVMAVHRALTSAIDLDLARIRAASLRLELGDAALRRLVTAAAIERTTHIMFAGNWIGAANDDARQLAIAGTPAAISATEAAVAALGPVLLRAAALNPFPPALTLSLTSSLQANGSFLVVATVRNVGGQTAEATTLSLGGDDAAGGAAQEVTIGAMPPGGGVQHVFAVALPAAAAEGTASITVAASNATPTVALVDLESN